MVKKVYNTLWKSGVFALHNFYYIRLRFPGRPAPAKFRSPTTSRSMDSYNLTWVIESAAHLEEVRLLYRKLEVMINVSSRDRVLKTFYKS